MQGPVTIEVAQTQNALNRRVEHVLAQAFGQQLILLACAALLVWLVLRRGMASVMRLRDEVIARTPGTLKPLLTERVPQELHPLAVAINDYTDRLDRYQSQRAQFIADASHQLRTPLTVLNTQVTYALRTDTPHERQEALLAIQDSVRHGTRIVNQMLSLSRVQAHSDKATWDDEYERDSGVASELDEVADVALLAQDVLEQHAVFAQARQLDLGFEHCTDNTKVSGSPLLIRELIANVLDNAIRYSHVGGQVNVSVGRSVDTVVLQVADEGPGIPVPMRERVFERFYRIDPSRADGCGLGLAIVREIAMTLGASVQLCEPKTGPGLLVEIRFVAVARNASDD
jgi:two-component system, OmpR family, sensor histidine kinase TctE